ncbi:MAG: uridine diphosphate-N-acetylglucosamine-binding protein YvcK [Dermatophilaceae bacterium]|nr:uridine diphosphate-N-acetylglucosamine-binding protein YvcK [Intrasporangiaceae bacterium]
MRGSGPPTVAALGGGHGLAATLSALRLLTDDVTAIVTVADNGGSSGRLRAEFGVLPPGDLRMALAALCDDSEWGHAWRDVMQHRFQGSGPLAGHALGNLLIVALWEIYEDPVAGLDLVGRLLEARGRVLPMAAVPLDIEADIRQGETLVTVVGQAEVATAPGRVEAVRLVPQEPPAYSESVAAIRAADWVVLGPGSWFTSVMPHLLVPDLRDALRATRARRALVLNLDLPAGETEGLTTHELIESFASYADDVRLDVVIADPSVVTDRDCLREAAAAVGAELVVTTVSTRTTPGHHDPLRLAAAFQDLFAGR